MGQFQYAIKEDSKVANSDWVDHQPCSLLQYINVIANLFIMGNYFNELPWKIIWANNLLWFIHQVTIEFRLWTFLVQERFKSNLKFRYQIIVSSVSKNKQLRIVSKQKYAADVCISKNMQQMFVQADGCISKNIQQMIV